MSPIMFVVFYCCCFLIVAVAGIEQRSDCVQKCAHLETSQEFGSCLKECSKLPRMDNLADVRYIADPPWNVTIETNVIIDEMKILETTIKWSADDNDSRRTGFYLKFVALNESCQQHFHGYFASSLPPTTRSLTIPAEFHGHSLIIEHSCVYSLQLRSIPYSIISDDRYTLNVDYKVPECIDKYCQCRDDDVNAIEDLHVAAGESPQKVLRVQWKFVARPSRNYTFYADIYERIGVPLSDAQRNALLFTYRAVTQQPFTISAAGGADEQHTIDLLFDYEPNTSYRLAVFAVDDRFCHNDDATFTFSTSNETLQLPPTQPPDKLPPVTDSEPPTMVHGNTLVLDSTTMLALAVFIAFASPLCTLLILYLLKWRKKRASEKRRKRRGSMLSCSRHSIMETNILYRPTHEVNHTAVEWQIQGNDVAVGAVIGEGAFGLVYKGVLRDAAGRICRVAVKQLKANALDEERQEFAREIQMMQTIGNHDNIVGMYGYCMDDTLHCMIMEYVPFGDLKHYLQNIRKQAMSEEPRLNDGEAHSFAVQIADGMAHLETVGIIHRDLAARNILVGTGNVLKISDFGMSRAGVYIKLSKGVIPLRWLSPEAIKDNTYSSKSDVWAFGVVLWEIGTLGGFPYQDIADKDLYNHLSDNHRLPKPAGCPIETYTLMTKCWSMDPNDRPSFAVIQQLLAADIV